MKIKTLVELVVLLFAVVFFSYFVFSRGKLFVDVYNAESAAYAEDVAENEKCETDHDYQHRTPMKCIKANLAAQRWWRWHAFSRVWGETYLCIDYPCTDLLRGAFDSWTSLAVLTAFLVAFFLVVCGGIFSRLERGEKLFAGFGKDRHPQVRTSPYFGENGPVVMVGYDRPPVEVVADAGDGLRNRFATWLPGQQRRVQELI
jgi:hypothetical protein